MNKQMGKTQWMLNESLGSIVAGQPNLVILGHTAQYSQQLKRRLIRMIEFETDLDITKIDYKTIDVEGSIVEFRGPMKIEDKIGRDNCGYFYDHYEDIGE